MSKFWRGRAGLVSDTGDEDEEAGEEVKSGVGDGLTRLKWEFARSAVEMEGEEEANPPAGFGESGS